MNIRKSDLFVSRVLAEDGDFATLEVGKSGDVVFNLQQNDEGEVVGGDKFLTVVFVRMRDGVGEVWNPFKEGE